MTASATAVERTAPRAVAWDLTRLIDDVIRVEECEGWPTFGEALQRRMEDEGFARETSGRSQTWSKTRGRVTVNLKFPPASKENTANIVVACGHDDDGAEVDLARDSYVFWKKPHATDCQTAIEEVLDSFGFKRRLPV